MQPIIDQIIIVNLLILLLLLALWRIGLWRLKKYPLSVLGQVEVFRKYNGEKLLTINSYHQGVSIEQKSIGQSYWYFVALKVIEFVKKQHHPQVLMLGLGAATIPRLIARSNPQICQTAVEIDPMVIQSCRDFFELLSIPNLTVKNIDVFKLIQEQKPFSNRFDVLIVDVWVGKSTYISPKSNSPTFIEQILPWLKKDGMIIFNRPAHTKEVKNNGFALKKYLQTLFKETEIFDIKDPRGYRNHVISAKGQY